MTATTRTPEKQIAFLAVLADTCNVSKACAAIGEARSTVYDWREACPEFAAAWDKARMRGADAIEDIAMARAFEGVDKPLHNKGYLTGEVAREYSDTLAIFLLKGFKPEKYKDRVSSEVSGPGGAPLEITDPATLTNKLASILKSAAARKANDGSDLA